MDFLFVSSHEYRLTDCTSIIPPTPTPTPTSRQAIPFMHLFKFLKGRHSARWDLFMFCFNVVRVWCYILHSGVLGALYGVNLSETHCSKILVDGEVELGQGVHRDQATIPLVARPFRLIYWDGHFRTRCPMNAVSGLNCFAPHIQFLLLNICYPWSWRNR